MWKLPWLPCGREKGRRGEGRRWSSKTVLGRWPAGKIKGEISVCVSLCLIKLISQFSFSKTGAYDLLKKQFFFPLH